MPLAILSIALLGLTLLGRRVATTWPPASTPGPPPSPNPIIPACTKWRVPDTVASLPMKVRQRAATIVGIGPTPAMKPDGYIEYVDAQAQPWTDASTGTAYKLVRQVHGGDAHIPTPHPGTSVWQCADFTSKVVT